MKKIKTLTMYLPQFHRTIENDTWWGEGFTEWTAVRNALPLFKNHQQPKKPLNNNYYNLLDKDTMLWQANLMQKYGIDGQCFYHYYFKNGRKVLERPAENLLKWKDINMPFCFCWANGAWSRTWSNIKGNSWGDIYEKKSKNVDESSDGILLEQKYGREQAWKEHLEYLLPFFKDERYIKINDKPVFMIYSPNEIYCLSPMIDYWNNVIKEHDIPGIYYIAMNTNTQINGIDAILFHAPHAYCNFEKNKECDGIRTENYEEVWRNIIKCPPMEECKTYFSGVVNCDDTPRRGYNGVYIRGYSPEKFFNGLCELYKKSIYLENEFVFLNAWNEWGEGMYLEPDEQRGYEYLECVKRAQIEIDKKFEYQICFRKENRDTQIIRLEKQGEKNRKIMYCLDRWMYLKEKNKEIINFLEQNSVKTVGIYGLGILGKHLLEELEESNISVQYIIDQRTAINHPRYKIISPEDNYNEVDAIIITAVGDFDIIYKKIKQKTKAKIFSIEEIIFES